MEFEGTVICRYWKLQVLEFAGTGICRYWNLQVLEFAGTGICRYWNLQVLEFAGTGICRYDRDSLAVLLLIDNFSNILEITSHIAILRRKSHFSMAESKVRKKGN